MGFIAPHTSYIPLAIDKWTYAAVTPWFPKRCIDGSWLWFRAGMRGECLSWLRTLYPSAGPNTQYYTRADYVARKLAGTLP